MRSEIERVVSGIREGFSEDLTLAELGEMARLSPFHMARLFRQETGLPPASFLMAVRLEEARRRLLHTQDSIADISVRCGYASIGAFTTRFTRTVGVSPGRYRRLVSLGSAAVDFISGGDDTPSTYGSVLGDTRRSDGMDGEPVFVAAFPAGRGGGSGASCRRAPRCLRSARAAGQWRIPHVPEGRWYVQAVSRSGGTGVDTIVVAAAGPLRVVPGSESRVELVLEPPGRVQRPDDTRVMLGYALPELFRV